MIIGITIIIFFIGAMLCVIKKEQFDKIQFTILKKLFKNFWKDEFKAYLVNCIITFLGVMLAIVFTDINTIREEKEKTVNFLDKVLLRELSTKGAFVTETMIDMNPEAYLQVTIEGEGLSEENTTTVYDTKFTPDELFEMMKVFPVVPVTSLDLLLTDSPYKYTISEYAYNALISCKINFSTQISRIQNETEIAKMEQHLKILSYEFSIAQNIVELELAYQNNKISENELQYKIDQIFEELSTNENAMVVGKGFSD